MEVEIKSKKLDYHYSEFRMLLIAYICVYFMSPIFIFFIKSDIKHYYILLINAVFVMIFYIFIVILQIFLNLLIGLKEKKIIFSENYLEIFFGTEVKTNILIKALENGDIRKFEKTLGEIMINMLSHFDLDKEMEKIYQVFMIGLVGFLMGKYEIISNDESGYGRYDLAMIPIKSNEKAYLMEFKISKTKKGMEESAEKALKQIDEKKYDTKLKARGIKNILKIGIAFYGKEVKVVFK